MPVGHNVALNCATEELVPSTTVNVILASYVFPLFPMTFIVMFPVGALVSDLF